MSISEQTQTQKIKVLFLDVDGVLNSYLTGQCLTLNKRRISLLKKIIIATNCKIVLSSTWRLVKHASEKLRRYLGYTNIIIYDVTPSLNALRGYEIREWLNTHIDVERYVIVDDIDEMLQEQQEYFVQTDPNKGLTIENVDKIIQILL